MSEEEKQIRSNLEKIIISLADELEWNADYEKEVEINRDMLDVLKESLNLIDKQQKEIEELKNDKSFLLDDLEGCISKDKIKAKIEELEEEGTTQYWDNEIRKMLQELLEE